ncbi:MAG: hypervirulence associated TUDOR domain-containing protein [Erythrobacter sp.]
MSNSNSFQTSQYVKWKWGDGYGKGQITERFEQEVTRTLQGSDVTKDGDEDNPAYLIEQEDGDEVLKRGSEIEAWDRG